MKSLNNHITLLSLRRQFSSEYNKVTVAIQWCGGWGYGPRFDDAKALIEANYKISNPKALENIQIVSKGDPNVTGNFEITVNGQLVHSKRTKGDGFIDENTPQKTKIVIDAIDQALKK